MRNWRSTSRRERHERLKMYEILDKINGPADIKALGIPELRQLCGEVRSYIIECCSTNPGHLASSLGAVELIVGMHYVFDAPKDKLVFDVGHQAYAHKILTGRREAFRTLRTEGGISGFPKRSESEYDCFGTGHSSTSISAALGFACAARIMGRDEKVVALIGDGAMTGGLAFEGLNNAGIGNADLLVLLNDNNQSIDGNIGAMHEHLLKLSTSESYNSLKESVWTALGEGKFRRFIQRWWRSLKSWAVKKTGGDVFEALGFRYFGPIDGNNIEEVVNALVRIRDLKGPRILHCLTLKGKGYPAAEKDPTTWHAPGRFNPATAERISEEHSRDRYQDVFGEVLCELASKDRRIVGITPAMAHGCGMNRLAAELPEQFFDVGIEEEHAVTFAAGLAAAGMKPFCNIYSSFAQRAYDELIHDAALQNLPVVLCLDRAGLVGEDGGTHQGAFDIAAFRCIPNVIISAPKDECELKNLMYSAALSPAGPYIIRYPRGMGEGSDWKNPEYVEIPTGSEETIMEGSEIAVIASGPAVNRAADAAAVYPGRVGVYNFRFIKPLDENLLSEIAAKYGHIITVEDGSLKGGLYGAVCEYLMSIGAKTRVEGIGIGDVFVEQARQKVQLENFGISREGIKKKIEKRDFEINIIADVAQLVRACDL